MTDAIIPPKALEAARDHIAGRGICIEPEDIEAACLAMLKAWQTKKHRMIVGVALDEVGGQYPAIILPLPKEPSDEG